MRYACCILALAAIGCGATPMEFRYRPVFVDPALGTAPEEALAEWQAASGGLFPPREISFYVSDLPGTLAGRTSPYSQDGNHFTIDIDTETPAADIRRVLLHELGHVAGLRFGPDLESSHYTGTAPSVMRAVTVDCADEIGAPELEAMRQKFHR